MKFSIPFTLAPIPVLRQKAQAFSFLIKHKRKSSLENYLKIAEVPITREEYLAISIRAFVVIFFFSTIISSTLLFFLNVNNFIILGLAIGLLFGLFVSTNQLIYPKIYVTRREHNIDKNLIPALEDMLVQLNSGVPLFSILVNISSADYGELSLEFKKAVKKINTGMPQIDVLDEMGQKNSSRYFRRTLWQISNGMKAGSDIGIVIKESMRSLNEEQLLQIQNYGNKLNPIIMFYMLISVILPALSITFLTIISSLVNLSKTITIAMFVGLFVFVVLIQIMFLGIMRSVRPSLL